MEFRRRVVPSIFRSVATCDEAFDNFGYLLGARIIPFV
jgi:hypothetical protein